MKTYPTNIVVGAEVVTPTPINDEFLDIANTANRLDDENFGALALASSKLALGAMHRLAYAAIETQQSVYLNLVHAGTNIGAVPDGSGNPWAWTVTTYGGLLYLTLRVAAESYYLFDVPPVTPYPGVGGLWVGLRVDGQLVARSCEQSTSTTTDTFSARAHVPVAAGSHSIEVVFGSDRPDLGYSTRGDEYATFLDRALCVMEAVQ